MEAGMEAGDVIMSFDGTDVEDTRQLVRVVGETAVGKAVDVVVFRGGEEVTLSVTLGRREEAEGAIPASSAPAEPEEPMEKDVLGLTVTAVTDELREELSLPEDSAGLVVRAVAEDSQAFDKGLRAGDVITEAGQQQVTKVTDLEDRIAEATEAGRKSLLLLVRRAGEPRFVALSLDES
jgi:serine protease Do